MKDIKKIYKRFIRDLSTTLLFSLTITVGVFLIYLICVAVFNTGIFTGLASNAFGQIFVLITLSMIIGLIAPFVYSFFACNGVLNTKKRDDVKYKSFLKTYLIGTRPPFNGQLRIWDTLLKSFLIYLGVELISLFFLGLIAQAPGSMFAPLFDEIGSLNMGDANYISKLETILHTYKDLIRSAMLITGFFSLFFSTYFFIHTMSKNTIRYFLAPTLLSAPNRLITFVYKNTMKVHKNEYRKKYYSTLWPITLVYVVAFTLSYFLIAYLGPSTIELPLLGFTSILITVIALAPLLPLVFNFHESIWPEYSGYFLNMFLESASRELSAVKSNLRNMESKEAARINNAEKELENIKEIMEKRVKQDIEENKDNEIKDDDSTNNDDTKE